MAGNSSQRKEEQRGQRALLVEASKRKGKKRTRIRRWKAAQGDGEGRTPDATPPGAGSPPPGGAPMEGHEEPEEHREFRRQAEEYRRPTIEQWAMRHGQSPEDYQDALTSRIRSLVQGLRVYHRTDAPERLAFMLHAGRLLSIFEVPSPATGAHVEDRLVVEAAVIGVPRTTPVAQRPIYGYLAEPDFVSDEEDIGTHGYGHVVLLFKRKVHARARIYFGDTIDDSATGTVPRAYSTNLSGPTHHSLRTDDDFDPLIAVESMAMMRRTVYYIDTPVLGGVSAEEIEVVLLPEPPGQELQALLRQRGIRWQVRGQD